MTGERTSEGLTCEVCGKVLKNKAGYQAHMSLKHKKRCEFGSAATRPPAAEPGGEAPSPGLLPSNFVKFRSPRAASLRVVVRPTYVVPRDTPAGTVWVRSEGKTAEFQNGILITDDQEIIDHLESKYKDDRFPILSDTKLREFARGLK